MDICHLLIRMFCFDQRHTSQNLCEELQRVTTKWDISQKVHAVTTDNAANVVNSVKLAGLSHIPCFAHTLNLVVQSSLKEIENIRRKVKSTVEHFHRSTQANAKFFTIQKQMNSDSDSIPLKLKNDVVTRWNSTFYMFERIIKLKEPLTATIGLLHSPVELLLPLEWTALEESCKILKPFEQVTSEMSAEKTVTLSKVINIVRGLVSFT
ncbi:hypothetical protein NQ315_011345 [Exocentrus adspersus]|uniref:Zinc finger BED domain-containing protein 4 n=1 Tax=Exocentrus adspersus TaxID=1586481 RepID=A0AAV8VJ25_9CUCU|nr:hypothetical protein NQ315_011345 [Exocentrus adspersus]